MEFPPLPDLCSLHILSYLPPRDLLGPIPLVCRAWYRLAREACRRTHSIVVIVGEEKDSEFVDVYMAAHYLGAPSGPLVTRMNDRAFRPRVMWVKLLVPNASDEARASLQGKSLGRLELSYSKRLVEVFPCVTSLELLIMKEPCMDNFDTEPLRYLLNGWASRLLRLGIWMNSFSAQDAVKEALDVYLRECNKLRHLRCLIIFFGRELFGVVLPRLEILGQLEQLDLSLPCSLERLLQSLIAQGPKGPARISLSQPFDTVRAVKYLNINGQDKQISVIARKFSHLRVVLSNDIMSASHLVDHFRHLHSLELSHEKAFPARMQELSYQLAHLNLLQTLKLHYSIRNLTDEDIGESPWYSLSSVRELMLEASTDPLTTAQGVHSLYRALQVLGNHSADFFTSHTWLMRELNPAVLFPSLESVNINGDLLLTLCGTCQPFKPYKTRYWLHKEQQYQQYKVIASECLCTILKPFNGCFDLKNKLIHSNRLPNQVNLVDGWTWATRDRSQDMIW